MSKTITIIELLNKIAKGEEVPDRIIYDNKIFKFDKETKTYRREDEPWLYLGVETKELNEEVEILEDEETIDIDRLNRIESIGWYTSSERNDLINMLIKTAKRHEKK